MRLAAFLAGVACGIGVCLWWIAKGMVTPSAKTETPRVVVGGSIRPGARFIVGEDGPETILPIFDPHLWRERMR